jgi:integrase/recombinase XerC
VKKKNLSFQAALKSFLGYLEGTHKSAHTLKCYRLDLLAFHQYLTRSSDSNDLDLSELSEKHIKDYRVFLEGTALTSNTRRRRLLTVQKFCVYLAKRKKLSIEVAKTFPVPHKRERIPQTFSLEQVFEKVKCLPEETILDRRNKALFWVLIETGCLVSEVCQIRFIDLSQAQGGHLIEFQGKSPRKLNISNDLFEQILRIRELSQRAEWVFLGFNRFGALGGAISSRGVELLFRLYSTPFEMEGLTARGLRHSVIQSWFDAGMSIDEVRRRLGLKSNYAFRWRTNIKSSYPATSSP